MDGFEHFTEARLHTRRAVASAMPTLLIIDDSRLRRDCLKAVLGQRLTGWRISEAQSARDLADGGDWQFDLVVLGGTRIDLEDVAALAAVAPVLVCCDCEAPKGAQRVFDAGARGFVPTSLGLGALLAAIERVRGGGRYVPAVTAWPQPPAATPVRQALTRRQREVLALITEGKSNKLIADALTMSEDTVKAHVKQIIKRLNVANRTQAALLAARAEAAPLRWEAAGR